MDRVTTFEFLQLDVFSEEPCRGNPVAIILDRDGVLDTAKMQRLANWTNLSETVVMTPAGAQRYVARIFTPHEELEFAGHPTIGAAHAALIWGVVEPGDFIQECGIGEVELSGSLVDGISAELASPSRITPEDVDSAELERALGQAVRALELLDIGPKWFVARVDSVDELYALEPDLAALAAFEAKHPPATGTTIYAVALDETVHVRSFAPRHGISEDPVCGSGNLCVGDHMCITGQRSPGESWVARQGAALGRDGRVRVRLRGDRIELGGRAVRVFEGLAHL